jgi:hypothetical protein
MQAYHVPTRPVDEALWFQRSILSPLHVEGEGRMWGIDIPAVNRWLWWAALKATGTDKVPRGEPPAWYLDDEGNMMFQGRWTLPIWLEGPDGPLDRWMARHGAYAPRRAILVMRSVNVAVFALFLLGLWYAGRRISGCAAAASLAIVPVALAPIMCESVAFVSLSGDVPMLAASTWALVLWLRGCERGAALHWRNVLGVGALCGLATASKHSGVLPLGAFILWLSLQGGIRRRIVNIALAGSAAFAVFFCLNPVLFLSPGEYPIAILMEMISRRSAVAALHVSLHGPVSWSQFYGDTLFWWLLVVPYCYALWRYRREWWAGPLALWSGVFIIGTLAGGVEMRAFHPHYRAPMEMALWWPLGLMLAGVERKA